MTASPAFRVTYAEIVAKFYPERRCIVYANDYAKIDWVDSEPVPKEELDALYITTLRERYIVLVKDEAESMRAAASYAVIGTDYPRMLLVYEKKKKEAISFMEQSAQGSQAEVAARESMVSALDVNLQAQLAVRYPILSVESEGTGVSMWQLAYAVLDQFRLSEQHLDPVLGQLEVIRRNKIYEYEQAQTEEAIRSIAAPIWPQVDTLQQI